MLPGGVAVDLKLIAVSILGEGARDICVDIRSSGYGWVIEGVILHRVRC